MASDPTDPTSSLWQAALARLESEVGETLYQTLFEMGRCKAVEGDEVIIAFPFSYLVKIVTATDEAAIARILSEILGRRVGIRFVVETSPETAFSSFAGEKHSLISQRKEQLLRESAGANGRGARGPLLAPSYQFDQFIVRDSNQLAFAGAKAVADHPGEAYNPLYLYGATGLGKSHLLQAIAAELRARHPEARVAVVSAENYANDFIEAIRSKSTKAFRDRYASLDLLLIDDLHFLINKPQCQESFQHTFNTFFDARKQIAVAADRKPRDLTGFQERLISRLEGGLIADITRPDFDTRLAILERKAKTMQLAVPREDLATIANLVATNVRALEGCLKMLRAQLTLRGGGALAHEDLEKLVLDFLSTTERDSEILDLNTIMEKLAAHYRVPITELISKKRTASVAHPRQMVMYFTRQLTNMSLEEIGRGIGGRDHSTVLYACQKIQGRAQVDPTFRREVEFVRSLLTGQRGEPDAAN